MSEPTDSTLPSCEWLIVPLVFLTLTARLFYCGLPDSALVPDDLIDSPDFDPRSAVVLEASESPAPTTSVGPVSGRVETESPDDLLLTDASSSGWSARIDRRETPIFHSNPTTLFGRSIRRGSGSREIVFTYLLLSFQVGRTLNLVELLVGAGRHMIQSPGNNEISGERR